MCSRPQQPKQNTTNKDKIAHDTLCRFIQITLQKNNQHNLLRLNKELDCITCYKPDSTRKWYLALSDCVPLLQLDRYKPLWSAIFERFRWDFPRTTLDAYCKFCTLLISNHPVAIKPVLQSCSASLMQRFQKEKCPASQKIGNDLRYGMIHRLLQQIHSNVPTMCGLLMNCLIDLFPSIFCEDSNIISCYVEQLLMIIQYIPELRPQIIQLIIEKMILIDVEIEKREKSNHKNNDMNESANEYKQNDDDEEDSIISDQREEVDENDENEDVLSNNLDHLMCLMFDYIKIIADDDKKLLNEMYQTISRIFETSILSTHEITSVQFVMFYLCSFRGQFAEEFVSRLMRLCTDTQRPTHERCFAAGYIGGYVSKAKYLRHISAFSTFDILIQWLIAYLQLYEKRYPFISNIGQREAKNHGLFYAVCQAVFRIYSHHQHTFDSMFQSNPKIPNWIYQISQSCLQPFKYCHGLLVQNFVFSVNKSTVMDLSLFPGFVSSKNVYLAYSTFTNWNLFPFDSYHLFNSSEYLDGLFRICGGMSPIRTNENDTDDGEDDDWIIKNTSDQIKPSNALTPSLGSMNQDNSDYNDDDDDDDFII